MKKTKTEITESVEIKNSPTISAVSPDASGGISTSTFMPTYDTEEPQPIVKYVKVKPKRIVIKCRCGGKLRSAGGMTIGWRTTWNNKCTKCGAHYAMDERAGDIVYE